MRKILTDLGAGIAALWGKGCLGKSALGLGGLLILGLCGSIVGGRGSPSAGPAPATAVRAVATVQPTEAPIATAAPTERPAAAPKPTAAPSFDHNGDGAVTCADFTTQADAQRALDAGHKILDGNDKDGRACESLP